MKISFGFSPLKYAFTSQKSDLKEQNVSCTNFDILKTMNKMAQNQKTEISFCSSKKVKFPNYGSVFVNASPILKEYYDNDISHSYYNSPAEYNKASKNVKELLDSISSFSPEELTRILKSQPIIAALYQNKDFMERLSEIMEKLDSNQITDVLTSYNYLWYSDKGHTVAEYLESRCDHPTRTFFDNEDNYEFLYTLMERLNPEQRTRVLTTTGDSVDCCVPVSMAYSIKGAYYLQQMMKPLNPEQRFNVLTMQSVPLIDPECRPVFNLAKKKVLADTLASLTEGFSPEQNEKIKEYIKGNA